MSSNQLIESTEFPFSTSLLHSRKGVAGIFFQYKSGYIDNCGTLQVGKDGALMTIKTLSYECDGKKVIVVDFPKTVLAKEREYSFAFSKDQFDEIFGAWEKKVAEINEFAQKVADGADPLENVDEQNAATSSLSLPPHEHFESEASDAKPNELSAAPNEYHFRAKIECGETLDGPCVFELRFKFDSGTRAFVAGGKIFRIPKLTEDNMLDEAEVVCESFDNHRFLSVILIFRGERHEIFHSERAIAAHSVAQDVAQWLWDLHYDGAFD